MPSGFFLIIFCATNFTFMRFFLRLFYLLFLVFSSCRSENPLEKIMQSEAPEIKAIAKAPDEYGIQIRYTQIDSDAQGTPRFRSYEYGVDENRYFYPASTAKLPIVVLALQRLRALQKEGVRIDTDTPFRIYDPKTGAPVAVQDSTHPKQRLTMAHLIKKIFLVSDNDAYNYLFDFLGKDYINTSLQNIGLEAVQIYHKFLFGADNTHTWEYVFGNDNDTLYHQKSIASTFAKTNEGLKAVKVGKGYIKENALVNAPMDFREKNRLSIRSLEGIIQRLIFPESFPKAQRFELAIADYEFLRYWMSRTTLESQTPKYTRSDGFYDSYVKFLIFGDSTDPMPKNIRIYNKVGDAYGTLTDTAYIEDKEAGISFFLTATVYVNENGIFNDDVYAYDRLGFPFLGELGRQVLAWEQKRKQAHRPALK